MNMQQAVPQEGDALSKVTALVKWFKAERGYGFMIPDDGREEVMIHLSCLKKYGFGPVDEGTLVECMVKQTPKGLQCIQILRVDPSTAVVTTPKKPPFADVKDISDWIAGTIKWFNAAKGFGFVECVGVDGDIFLHMETVRAANIEEAPEIDASLWVKYGQGPKGFIATAVSVTQPQV